MSRHIEKLTEPADAHLDRIERRVAGREMANDLIEFIGYEIDDAIFMESVIQTLSVRGLPKAEPQPVAKPEPIGRLGATVIPFGQHSGKTFDAAPLDYLDWICRSQEEFYRDLRAYLRHPDLESRRRGVD
jgi:hypothetical protein